MPSATDTGTPGLSSYLRSLRSHPADTLVEHFISLLKRRQIQGSRPCATATTHLFLRVVAEFKLKDPGALLERVRRIGRRLIDAQPRELVVGNIVRRVLGLIREVTEGSSDRDKAADLTSSTASLTNSSSYLNTIRNGSPAPNGVHGGSSSEAPLTMKDVKEDVLNGLREMLDELEQADEQVAGYALDHIHASEVVLTYTSSLTVQKFLLSAAKRRKFTVVQVEGYPNTHEANYDTITSGRRKTDDDTENGGRLKSLTSAGVTVIFVPDSAVFAIMSRVNKVILPAHAILSNGGFTGAAGVRNIAKAAKYHHVPVIALGAVYKLSPLYPANEEDFKMIGDAGKVMDYREGDLMDQVEVVNPILDYIAPDLVDLFVSNIGSHAPAFMFRIVADHYRDEDIQV